MMTSQTENPSRGNLVDLMFGDDAEGIFAAMMAEPEALPPAPPVRIRPLPVRAPRAAVRSYAREGELTP